jgi:mono/diheme cytochrome c family protein
MLLTAAEEAAAILGRMSRTVVSTWSPRGTLAGLAAGVAIAAGVPAAALAHGSAGSAGSAKIVGNAKAGKPIFISTCGVCHKLKAAKSVGTIGPPLDKVKLTEAKLIKAITNGGASVMTKAQVAKYATHMTKYKGVLSTKQIQDVAAFVYVSTHPPTK